MITIRPELPTDQAAITAVNTQAFPTPAEAGLVHTLREQQLFLLSLVAELDDAAGGGAMVGHVLFTPAVIVGENGRFPAVALGPVAVSPARQRQGIGSRLIHTGLDSLRQAGHARAIVLGDPRYYARFGFVAAAQHQIRCTFAAPPEDFMVMPLRPGGLDGVRGVAHYLPEFDSV